MIRELDWQTWTNQPVRVYRNLNNGRMSVQGKCGKSWKVIGHVTDLAIADVTFTIRDSGRLRVIDEGRKNVHAWASGVLLGPSADAQCDISLSYNPYNDLSFKDRDSQSPIHSARFLVVVDNAVWVSRDAIADNSSSKPPLRLISSRGAAIAKPQSLFGEKLCA